MNRREGSVALSKKRKETCMQLHWILSLIFTSEETLVSLHRNRHDLHKTSRRWIWSCSCLMSWKTPPQFIFMNSSILVVTKRRQVAFSVAVLRGKAGVVADVHHEPQEIEANISIWLWEIDQPPNGRKWWFPCCPFPFPVHDISTPVHEENQNHNIKIQIER